MRSIIAQYLIYEGIDIVGKVTLLANDEISPLMKLLNGVWLWVLRGQ